MVCVDVVVDEIVSVWRSPSEGEEGEQRLVCVVLRVAGEVFGGEPGCVQEGGCCEGGCCAGVDLWGGLVWVGAGREGGAKLWREWRE